MIQPLKSKGTCVAGAIEALDPEIKVICFLVADVQRDAAAIGRKR